MAMDSDPLQFIPSVALDAAEGRMDPAEALRALEAEISALEAEASAPEKPQKLTVKLIASRGIDAAEIKTLSTDDVRKRRPSSPSHVFS